MPTLKLVYCNSIYLLLVFIIYPNSIPNNLPTDQKEGLAAHERGMGWRRVPKPRIPPNFFKKCTETKVI